MRARVAQAQYKSSWIIINSFGLLLRNPKNGPEHIVKDLYGSSGGIFNKIHFTVIPDLVFLNWAKRENFSWLWTFCNLVSVIPSISSLESREHYSSSKRFRFLDKLLILQWRNEKDSIHSSSGTWSIECAHSVRKSRSQIISRRP